MVFIRHIQFPLHIIGLNAYAYPLHQFNLVVDDTDAFKYDLRPWKHIDIQNRRPRPLVIETYLDADELTRNQALVITDLAGNRYDAIEALQANQTANGKPLGKQITLEQWRINLGEQTKEMPSDISPLLATLYKKCVVMFRSIYTQMKFLPAWAFVRRQSKFLSQHSLKIRYRIFDGEPDGEQMSESLAASLYHDSIYEGVTDTYDFKYVDSPAGPLAIKVTFRKNCDFCVDDWEALLSSRFMGAENSVTRPSSQNSAGLGEKEFATNEFDKVASPSQPITMSSHAYSLPTRRRSSLSFQIFKAPPLSASPLRTNHSLPTSSASGPTGMMPAVSNPPSEHDVSLDRTSASPRPPLASSMGSRKAMDMAGMSQGALSASPRPNAAPKYSSSFSNRRRRISSVSVSNKTEGDYSVGRTSSGSSSVQPSPSLSRLSHEMIGGGSGGGGSAQNEMSINSDQDDISEFLKMLDANKDAIRKPPTSTAETETYSQGTVAALARFRRMRDSNARLSDSMSASFLDRSS